MLSGLRANLSALGCPECRLLAVRPLWPYVSCSSTSFKKRERDDKKSVFDYGQVQTDRRRIYVFGSSSHGALGLASLLKPNRTVNKRIMDYVHRPIRNDFGGWEELQDIAVGHGFTLVKTKPRRGLQNAPTLFGTGLNTHSQLGYQSARADAPLKILIGFVPISLSTDFQTTTNILALGAGKAHSVVSLEGEGLVTLGDNSNGQCGRIPISNEQYFGSKILHRIPAFGSGPEDDVVSIVSRFDVTLCLTRGGQVYTFGANNLGQLGRGQKLFKHWVPDRIVEGDLQGETVIKLATSGSSVIALSENGKVFSWGCNETGHANPYEPGRTFYEPRFVPLNEKLGKIVDVAIGEMTSHVVNERGDVYAWGRGPCLGLGPKNTIVKTPTLMPPPLFGRNEFNPNLRVSKIFSGFFYAAAVTTGGDIYSWGVNESGCLGLGLEDGSTQPFPLKVCLSGMVEKVGIGVEHTIVLSRGGI